LILNKTDQLKRYIDVPHYDLDRNKK
jgi:hypothetical protein